MPKPALSKAESKRLQVNLGYLCSKGLASLNGGTFEKLEDDLYELRLITLTQAQLAEKLGVQQAAVSKLELLTALENCSIFK